MGTRKLRVVGEVSKKSNDVSTPVKNLVPDWWPHGEKKAFSAAFKELETDSPDDRRLHALLTDSRMCSVIVRLASLKEIKTPRSSYESYMASHRTLPRHGSLTLGYLLRVAELPRLWDQVKSEPSYFGNKNEAFNEIRRSAIRLENDLRRHGFEKTYQIGRIPCGNFNRQETVQIFLEILKWVAHDADAYGAYENWLSTQSDLEWDFFLNLSRIGSRKKGGQMAIAWFCARYAAQLWKLTYANRVSNVALATLVTVLLSLPDQQSLTAERVKYLLRDDKRAIQANKGRFKVPDSF